MILKYFKAKKSKKILLKTLKSLLMEYVKRAEEPTERAPNGQSWKNLSNKINQVVLDYNPKQKIHDIHVPIIEQINKWQRRGNSHLEKFQLIYVEGIKKIESHQTDTIVIIIRGKNTMKDAKIHG